MTECTKYRIPMFAIISIAALFARLFQRNALRIIFIVMAGCVSSLPVSAQQVEPELLLSTGNTNLLSQSPLLLLYNADINDAGSIVLDLVFDESDTHSGLRDGLWVHENNVFSKRVADLEPAPGVSYLLYGNLTMEDWNQAGTAFYSVTYVPDDTTNSAPVTADNDLGLYLSTTNGTEFIFREGKPVDGGELLPDPLSRSVYAYSDNNGIGSGIFRVNDADQVVFDAFGKLVLDDSNVGRGLYTYFTNTVTAVAVPGESSGLSGLLLGGVNGDPNHVSIDNNGRIAFKVRLVGDSVETEPELYSNEAYFIRNPDETLDLAMREDGTDYSGTTRSLEKIQLAHDGSTYISTSDDSNEFSIHSDFGTNTLTFTEIAASGDQLPDSTPYNGGSEDVEISNIMQWQVLGPGVVLMRVEVLEDTFFSPRNYGDALYLWETNSMQTLPVAFEEQTIASFASNESLVPGDTFLGNTNQVVAFEGEILVDGYSEYFALFMRDSSGEVYEVIRQGETVTVPWDPNPIGVLGFNLLGLNNQNQAVFKAFLDRGVGGNAAYDEVLFTAVLSELIDASLTGIEVSGSQTITLYAVTEEGSLPLVVEKSTDLENWSELMQVTPTNSTFEITDSTGEDNAYYRINRSP